MTAATPTAKTYTEAEYLAREVDAVIRSEFRDGEIIEMAGGTPAHNRLSIALSSLFWFELRTQPYGVFASDQRLWIPKANLCTYPDVMVIAEPVELKPDRKDTVMNPVLIAEILADSTQGYDRGERFAHYRTIDTFQEYLLIDQYRPYVEHHLRQGARQWLLTEYSSLEDTISLASVTVDLALADLYQGVQF